MKRLSPDVIAPVVSVLGGLFLAFAYGVLCVQFHLFPYGLVWRVQQAFGEVFGGENDDDTWYAQAPSNAQANPHQQGVIEPGVNLITGLSGDRRPTIQLMTSTGESIREWDADWFRVWPNATHLPEADLPKKQPGTHIHGAVMLQDGGVVFSYSGLGLVKLDVCGDVVWRLPYRTHHSVMQDATGVLWVPGQVNHEGSLPAFPSLRPPFVEETLLRVSPEGQIIDQISVLELLRQNDLEGLLTLTTANGSNTTVGGDFLHANDFEPFPAGMPAGFFGAGDVLVSLRNANTLLVFNIADRKIKWSLTGHTIRQHDPDFVDGNTIGVFDNQNILVSGGPQASRILKIHAPDNAIQVVYAGSQSQPFFTDVMGKLQWLSNGHVLVTEARAGRAFELTPQGQIVWEYFHTVGDNRVGLMEEMTRLPEEYRTRVELAAKRCH
jgi:Arylsulfotransferase (ASST)